jgi:hypothetical protein
MKTIELSTAVKPLATYAQEFYGGPVVLTLNHQPTAIVISLAPADVESFALSLNPQFLEIIENARTELKLGKKLSLEEMKQEIW